MLVLVFFARWSSDPSPRATPTTMEQFEQVYLCFLHPLARPVSICDDDMLTEEMHRLDFTWHMNNFHGLILQLPLQE